MIEITLDMKIPSATAQQIGLAVRNGRAYTYKKQKVRDAEKEFAIRLMPHRPKKPIEGAVFLSIEWYYGTKDKKKQYTLKTTRPDLDNLNKILQDSLVKVGFMKDDSQIARLKATKAWIEGEDRIVVKIASALK